MKTHSLKTTGRTGAESGDKKETESDETRPVRFVPDGYNSWRVVWADEVIDCSPGRK